MMRMASRALRRARKQWRQLWNDDKGSAIALLAVLPVLAGAVAIGVETGQLYRMKRQMQGASDAAALAGAIDRMASKTNTVITQTARYEAGRNGFSNGTGGVTVAVNAPPTTGPNVTTAGAVEVVITKSTGFSLGKVLMAWLNGATPANFNMRTRSVAAQGSYTQTTTSYEGCLVALTTAAEQGVSFTSFNNFNSDCTIVSNGSATGSGSNASITISSFNTATLYSIWTRGSLSVSSYNKLTYGNDSAPLTNQTTTISDPYASLPTPTPGLCTYNNFNQTSGSSYTLSPGTYCGGLTVRSVNDLYLTPGIYYVANGDVYFSSVNNITCPTCTPDNGVAIVLTQNTGNDADIGGVMISSDNNIRLNAGKTNTGPYTGVLFYQDRRANTGTMTSSSKIFTVSSLNNATLSGAIYFPNNRIDISSINNFGGTASTGCTIFVGRYIKFSSFNNNYKGGCSAYGTAPVGIVTTTTVYKGKVFE